MAASEPISPLEPVITATPTFASYSTAGGHELASYRARMAACECCPSNRAPILGAEERIGTWTKEWSRGPRRLSLSVAAPASGNNAPVQSPETRYARSGDVWIAYQVFGDGPVDLVFAPGYVSNIELGWSLPKLSKT